MPFGYAVFLHAEAQSLIGQFAAWIVFGLFDVGGLFVLGVGREINSAALTFGDNRHKLSRQPASLALVADVFKRDIRAAEKTACAVAINRAFGGVLALPNFKANLIAVDYRLDEHILLGRELKGMDERHFVLASGIRASDGTRPQPRDNRFAVRLRIESADFLESLSLEHFAVVENVCGEPLRTVKNFVAERALRGVAYGWAVFELGGQLNHRFVNHDCDGVKVGGISFESEPLSLKGNGAAARERVKHCRQIGAD